MKKQMLILLATLAVTINANALFEIRAGYGLNTPSDDTADIDPGAGGGTATFGTMTGFNLDGIVKLPLVPFGFGLRYESMGLDVDVNGVTADTDLERIALLVNYRFIDTLIYLGAIGSIGFSNEVSAESLGVTNEYDADLTYSIGAEAGVGIGLFFVGAELGYNIATYDAKNPAVAGVDEVDFSGVYAKALVGVGF